MEDAGASKLGDQRLGIEEPLEDSPAGSVLQSPLLPLSSLDPSVQGGVDDDELRCDATGLREELPALAFLEMPVEVAREDAFEPAILERERECVSPYERRPRVSSCRHSQHRLAVVESDDLAAKPSRDESCAARDVERPPRREALERGHQLVPLLRPAGGHRRVQALSEPPVVVLGCPTVVVLLHRS